VALRLLKPPVPDQAESLDIAHRGIASSQTRCSDQHFNSLLVDQTR
jgi:hypothetical protein